VIYESGLIFDYPKTEGEAIIFLHNFPKDAAIRIIEAHNGMTKRVMIGNVDITIFEEEDHE
jgi:hypothetical protein